MKTGPFAEHSNQLWNISAVPSWSKVNQGLIKMYRAEVGVLILVLVFSGSEPVVSFTLVPNRTKVFVEPTSWSNRTSAGFIEEPRWSHRTHRVRGQFSVSSSSKPPQSSCVKHPRPSVRFCNVRRFYCLLVLIGVKRTSQRPEPGSNTLFWFSGGKVTRLKPLIYTLQSEIKQIQFK